MSLSCHNFQYFHVIQLFSMMKKPFPMFNYLGLIFLWFMSQMTQANWEIVGENISSGEIISNLKLVINNGPYIAFVNEANSKSVVVKKYDGSWVPQDNLSLNEQKVSDLNFSFDNLGIAYVAFVDAANSKSAIVEKYDTINSKWVQVGENLSSGKSKISYLNLVLDSMAIPYVAFVDEANSSSVIVKRYEGSWIPQNALSFKENKVSDLNFVFDSADTPYVAFVDAANATSVVVKKYYNYQWETVGGNPLLDGEKVSDLNLIIADLTPYIAFVNKKGGQEEVIVKKYLNGQWGEIECGKMTSNQKISELTLASSSSDLYLGFKEGNKIGKVMKYVSSCISIITTLSADQTIFSGEQATLKVETKEPSTTTYQWYQGDSGDMTSIPIPNATSATFETPILSETTSYWVRVKNGTESEDSQTIIVTVLPPISQEPPSQSETDSTNSNTLAPYLDDTLLISSENDFVPQEFTLSVEVQGKGHVTSIPSGIHCDASACHDGQCEVQKCSLTLPALTAVKLIPQPDQDSELSSWGGNPDCSSGLVTLDRSMRCVAYFHQLPKKLKVTHIQHGRVSSFPAGLSCGTEDNLCEQEFKANTLVRLLFTPQGAWFLAGWSGACNAQGEVLLDQASECSPQVLPLAQTSIPNSSEVISPPISSKEIYILSVEIHGQGTVVFPMTSESCQETCTQNHEEGNFVTMIAQAHEGYTFSRWGGACQGIDPKFQVTMTAHQYCEAYFQLIDKPQETTLPTTETVENPPVQLPSTEAVEIPPSAEEKPLENSSNQLPSAGEVETPSVTEGKPENPPDQLLPPITISPESSLCPLEGTINHFCRYNDGEQLENITVGPQGNISNVILKGTIQNQGWISNMTLTQDSFLKGGVLTGYVTNEGVIQDIVFQGAVLAGGILAGNIVSQHGIIQDVKFAPNSYMRGGQLQGKIEGDKDHPFLLEEISIMDGTELSYVSVGKGVKLAHQVHLGPGVTFIDASSLSEQETNVPSSGDQTVENTVIKDITVNQVEKISHAIFAGKIVNQGIIADSILQEESSLTGGILTGQIINYGTLKNIEFQGNYLRGGLLTGEIKNTQGGILEEVELNSETHLVGGRLVGPIEGHGAYLEQVIIQGEVKDVVIGQQVKNEGIIQDSEFRGELLEGGEMSGHLTNTQGGTLRNIYFLPNSSLHGGNVQGRIIGDPDAPVRLDDVRIAQGSYLENVIIGDQVFISKEVELGPGVHFISPRLPQLSTSIPQLSTSIPPLAIGINRQGQVISSHTIFVYHLNTSKGQDSPGTLLSHQEAQEVTASATLTLDTDHVGRAGEILLASVYKSSPTNLPEVYMRTDHRWAPWDYQLNQLKAFKVFQKMPEKVTVPIFTKEDLSALPGGYTLFVGYRLLDDQTIIYNGKMPFSFFVDSTPKNCILYAVHDEKKNDSQLLKIDLSQSLWGTMQAFGPLYKGRDIEGLTLHPDHPHVLYATSGDDAEVGGQKLAGYLYTIDKKTAHLTLVGPTGFSQVAALGIDPVEKVLWGWAEIKQGQQRQWSGLIQIDPNTGQGTPIKQFSSQETMGGLAVSPDGQKIYTSSGKTLWVYDKQTQEIRKICGQITKGRIEGLDMQPNGILLLGIDLNQATTITAYDPQKCEIIKTRTYQEVKYDDIESIVWPAAECNDQSWLSSHSE